ncbi:MAG: flavin reductase family protein [Clostridia bacterium]|nr:flavin reductase family protein [Clostridia bacterium]MBQ8164177.1 flavin reductase family protein [Clostridia bacterium]
MKKQVWKGTVLTSPVPPVMVSCGDMEESNIVTVAWTGTVNTKPPMTYISLRPSRHSYGIIKEKGEFVINLTPTSLIKKADYCGIYTGKKVNKFEKCGFTKAEATEVSAPLIAECPINLECKVEDIIPLGTHDMFLAEIVAVHVDEALVDGEGKLHLERADLTAYAHGDYYSLGKKLAPFGISVKNKKKHTHNKK